MLWGTLTSHSTSLWRQVFCLLSGIILLYSFAIATSLANDAFINGFFALFYLISSQGLLTLKRNSIILKQIFLGLFLLWLITLYITSSTLSPLWITPLLLLFCLSFEIGLLAFGLVTLIFIGVTQWEFHWPYPIYGLLYASLSILMVLLAYHRHHSLKLNRLLLHYDVSQNTYYESHLSAYLNREIHRCEREGAGLIVVAMRCYQSGKTYHLLHQPQNFFYQLKKGLRPFDGLFTYKQGAMLVFPYFTAEETRMFCQNLLKQFSVKAYIGISRYNLDQNPNQLIETAWQAAKTAERQQQPWVLYDE